MAETTLESKLNFNHYLPETEKRVECLRKVIRGRPCAILLPGSSISKLKRRIKELKDLDICYASVNDYWIMEDAILSKIGKKLDIIMRSAIECRVPGERDFAFLKRKGNFFISERAGYFENQMPLGDFLSDRVLFFVAERSEIMHHVPSPEYPLHFFAQASFTILTQILMIGGASLIVWFGADGGLLNWRNLYFGGWASDSLDRLKYDTETFNFTFQRLLSNVHNTWGKNPPLINCSEKSHYKVIKKVSYDEAFKELHEAS